MANCGCSDEPERGHEHGCSDPVGPVEVRAEAQSAIASPLAAHADALLAHPSLLEHLAGTEHRLLSLRSIDAEGETKRALPCAPQDFHATVYDYTNNRALEVRGAVASLDPGAPDHVEVQILGHQPLPSTTEFAAAVDVLRHDRDMRALIDDGVLQPYRPMPPLVDVERADGRVERVLAVGLRNTAAEHQHHEVVGVSMFDRRILRDLPGVVRPNGTVCEPPPGVDDCPPTGHDGQVWVTVTQGNETLWRFLAVRPAASSGTNGSGIELRYVDFRGKRVLYRAHVPILNVEYEADGIAIRCGPTYRDWQNEEACFQADGPGVLEPCQNHSRSRY